MRGGPSPSPPAPAPSSRSVPGSPPDSGYGHAPGGALERARDVSGHRSQRIVQCIELRQCVQQSAGVGVGGRAQHVAHRAALDDPPQVHHRDPVGGLRNHAEIVGDEQDRHAELGHQRLHEVEDLGLDGHIERGGRLVRNEEPRAGRERHRDHRPLAHSAGELEGVLIEATARVGDPHSFQHLHRVVAGGAPGQIGVQIQLLDHLASDGDAGGEARHRLLEDHRDGAAPHDHQVARTPQSQHADRAAVEVEVDPARGVVARVAGVEPHQGLRGDRLARAGFPDEAEHLPGRNPERGGFHRSDQPLVGAKAHRQVLHLDERRAHRRCSEYGSAASRSPSPTNTKASTSAMKNSAGMKCHW